MNLLDAPKFDEVRRTRRRMILIGLRRAATGAVCGLVASGLACLWTAVERNNYLHGRAGRERVLTAIEKNDLPRHTASGPTTSSGSSIQ